MAMRVRPNPKAYLRYILERIGGYPTTRVDELLYW